jgi:DNA-binding PadR family transcriptional regulator
VATSQVAVWRDALCEDECKLDSTAKLVALVLSTFMRGRGYARPGRERLGKGASLSVRSVERALRRLEAGGWLEVDWSDGGRRWTNAYQALLPETASEVRRSEWAIAKAAVARRSGNGDSRAHKGDSEAHKGVTDSPESVESVEGPRSGRLGGAAYARPVDECMGGCGQVRPLNQFGGKLLCDVCTAETAA